jgi:hypothetical protein
LTDKVTEWQQLETAMRKLYEDEMRQLQEVLKFEDTEEHDGREFRVPSTGAVLDLDNAVSHLHHFCATLPAKEYVDMRPDFIFYEAAGLIKAKVVLPSVVNEAIRTAERRMLHLRRIYNFLKQIWSTKICYPCSGMILFSTSSALLSRLEQRSWLSMNNKTHGLVLLMLGNGLLRERFDSLPSKLEN